ncbi:MAG: BNR-4 repeat-containing protein, partial [Candidatus Hodarchaeota archaeon]
SWLATIEMGHYQISWRHGNKVGTAFNYHPEGKGLNYRTNLYYMETLDGGLTWQTMVGENVDVPIQSIQSNALIHDFRSKSKLVYLKDLNFDANGNPIILFLSSSDYKSGPQATPRTWTTARWNGSSWKMFPEEPGDDNGITSDSNYDTGCIHVENDGTWRIIGPSGVGPQPFNPGGEIELFTSINQGETWKKERVVTKNSKYNHTYARRPVNAHRDFYALWADGNPRKMSRSSIYFCNADGSMVKQLPFKMKDAFESPVML